MRVFKPFGAVLTMAAALLLADGPAQAACTWSFNWYCSNAGCSRTMGRSTGTVDGFASETACNSARGNWRSKGVDTTGSCNRSGICDSPTAAPSGAPRGGQGGGFTGGGTPMPAYDDEADRLAREQAEAEQRAAKQKAEQEARLKAEQEKKFQQGKQEALGSLKGTGTQDGLELKTPSTSGGSPELKAAVEAPRLKQPSPPTREKVATANSGTLEPRVLSEPPAPWPVDKIKIDWEGIGEGAISGLEGVRTIRDIVGATVDFPGLFSLNVVVFGGKLLLAGEKGARAYVLRRNDQVDAALGYLKSQDESVRLKFMETVRALREKRPLDHRSVEQRAMIDAAKAMLDPQNAESHAGYKIAWNLLQTPEAMGSMGNFLVVESASWALGKAARALGNKFAAKVDEQELRALVPNKSINKDGWVHPQSVIDAAAVQQALATVKEVKGPRDKAVTEAFEILRVNDVKLKVYDGQFKPSDAPERIAAIKEMIKAEALIVRAYGEQSMAIAEALAGWSTGKGVEEYQKRREAKGRP